jgi:hypothetical protein
LRLRAAGCENSSTSSRPARLEHALHRGERRGLVRDVAQTEADRHAVERRVGKRQALGIGDSAADIAQQPAIEQPVAADLQHRRVDVGQHDEPVAPTWPAMPAARSPVPPATSSALWPGLSPGLRQRELLPDAVHAARHQVVHEVVATRDESNTARTRRVFSAGATCS